MKPLARRIGADWSPARGLPAAERIASRGGYRCSMHAANPTEPAAALLYDAPPAAMSRCFYFEPTTFDILGETIVNAATWHSQAGR